jgi:hypothetical protein
MAKSKFDPQAVYDPTHSYFINRLRQMEEKMPELFKDPSGAPDIKALEALASSTPTHQDSDNNTNELRNFAIIYLTAYKSVNKP